MDQLVKKIRRFEKARDEGKFWYADKLIGQCRWAVYRLRDDHGYTSQEIAYYLRTQGIDGDLAMTTAGVSAEFCDKHYTKPVPTPIDFGIAIEIC